jgi:hypothetical protein
MGEAFTHPYPRRDGAHWVDFLERVDMWIRARPNGYMRLRTRFALSPEAFQSNQKNVALHRQAWMTGTNGAWEP